MVYINLKLTYPTFQKCSHLSDGSWRVTAKLESYALNQKRPAAKRRLVENTVLSFSLSLTKLIGLKFAMLQDSSFQVIFISCVACTNAAGK